MGNPYIGETLPFAGTYIPEGYLACDGSTYPISSYPNLAAVIGNTYGGDGVTTFAVPDLRGRVALGAGQRPGNAAYPQGQMPGNENVTLTVSQLPSHSHTPNCSTNAGNTASPSGAVWAQVTGAAGVKGGQYSTSTTYVNMGTATGATGANSAHSNIQPVLAITFCISTSGNAASGS